MLKRFVSATSIVTITSLAGLGATAASSRAPHLRLADTATSAQAPEPNQDPKQDPKKDPPQKPGERGRGAPPAKPAPVKPEPQRPEPQRPQPQARPQRPEPQRPQPPPPQPQAQRPQPQRPQPPQPQRPQAQPQRPQPQPQTQRPQGAQPRSAQPRPTRLGEQEQQQRIAEQQQRLTQYSAVLDQQQRAAEQRSAQLQQQKRTAQYGFQLQYLSRMREQEQRLRGQSGYSYGGDPFFYTPASYRYARGGRFYETNEFGAHAMREALNYGYQEGFEAGVADRQDRWAFSYRDSFAYQDGNYGYSGFYVDRDTYNYYFREGFRRGYEDGYYGRSTYGVHIGGTINIFGNVVSAILGLQNLR